jgi:hypothetical protein
MSLDRQAAKAAGYTDAEIDAYEAEQKQKGAPAPEVSGTEPPPPPPPSPTQNEVSDVNYGELATTMGLAAAPYVLPAVGVGAAGYGALKVGGWGRNLASSAKDVSTAMRERTAVEAAREARMGSGGAYGRTPTPTPAGPQLLGPGGQPLPASTHAPVSGPVAPNPAAQPVPAQTAGQPGIAERVRQIAMQRIAPVAQAVAPVARAATGVGAALMPGNMGQNYPFPQSGPMRGQEINPATGRPWTAQELQQYNSQMR